jgi:hypothetical protein
MILKVDMRECEGNSHRFGYTFVICSVDMCQDLRSNLNYTVKWTRLRVYNDGFDLGNELGQYVIGQLTT